MGGYASRMDQHAFLRRASAELGLSYPQLAAELGVSDRTVEKWSLKASSTDHRAMPLVAIRLTLRMLDDRKRELLARGDRAGAEAIDALGAQVDPARVAASMRTFDALQRSMGRLSPPIRRRKPRAFATLALKNAWERREETRHARLAQAAAAGKR
jgi:transcriptional regulator with XRE-family HTH domain